MPLSTLPEGSFGWLRRLAFLALAAAPFTASAQQAYAITQSTNGAQLSMDSLVRVLAQADVVVFGEEHDDDVGHQAQLAVLVGLFRQAPARVALSLEMFETDHQQVLDEYLAGLIPERDFVRDADPWPNYEEHYRPLVEFARQHRVPVTAANAPARYVSMVNRRGRASLDSLDEVAKAWLPELPYDTLGGRYREKFYDLMGGDNGHMSPNLYHAQNLWDATMASRALDAHEVGEGYQVLHLCGRFHSDEYLGTVEQLRRLAPELRVVTISSFPGNRAAEGIDPRTLADYVIVTPAVEE